MPNQRTDNGVLNRSKSTAFDMYGENPTAQSETASIFSGHDAQYAYREAPSGRRTHSSSGAFDMFSPAAQTVSSETSEAEEHAHVVRRHGTGGSSHSYEVQYESEPAFDMYSSNNSVDDTSSSTYTDDGAIGSMQSRGDAESTNSNSCRLLQPSRSKGKQRTDSIDPSQKLPVAATMQQSVRSPTTKPSRSADTKALSAANRRCRSNQDSSRSQDALNPSSKAPLRLQDFEISLPEHIEHEDRFHLCQKLVTQRMEAVARLYTPKAPEHIKQRSAPPVPLINPQEQEWRLADACCFACAAKLRTAGTSKPYRGNCVRTAPNSLKRRPLLKANKSQSLLSLRYLANLHRLSEDASIVPRTSLHPPFVVPRNEEEVRACIHDLPPNVLPQRPFEDDDGDCYFVDDSNNVQQFFFQILTHRKCESWLGETLAMLHPMDVSQLCRSFQVNKQDGEIVMPRPLRAQELQAIVTRNGLRRASTLMIMVPIQKLMLEIVWLCICELRDDATGARQARVDIKGMYRKYGQQAADRAAVERDQARAEAKQHKDSKQWGSFSLNRATLKRWKKKAQASATSLIPISRSSTKLGGRGSQRKSTRVSHDQRREGSEPGSQRTSASIKSRWSLGILRSKNLSCDNIAGSEESECEPARRTERSF